jgi:transcriptional regulator of NAD metabolism
MADHPVVVIEHPIASKTKDEIHGTARNSVQRIVEALRKS